MQLAGASVGEDQQQAVAELVGEQPSRLAYVRLPHPAVLRRFEGDVQHTHALEIRDALCVLGQFGSAAWIEEWCLPLVRVEVQRLDEQLADRLRPPLARRAEDAVDVRLDLGGVVAVTDRHTRSSMAAIAILPDGRR